MKISIRKPIGYTRIGRKDCQEDAVWPAFADVTASSRCIVLCDGVGGSAHGEIASQTVSRVVGEYLTDLLKKQDVVTADDMHDAVFAAYDELERIDTGDAVGGQPSMATTLTCVCIHDEGILASHMGDSRIYLVRPGQGLLYQSSDHSLVNALLQAGELTAEEAKTFPRRNVITKAIQPHGPRRFEAESHQLTDLRSGDYIFMCCDGVLEQLTNERLVEILSMKCSDEKKLALLEAESTDRTKDNYTAYLIPISKVEGESSLSHDDDVATEVEVTAIDEAPEVTRAASAPAPAPTPSKGISKGLLILLLVLIIGGAAYYIGRKSASPASVESQDLKEQVAGDKDKDKDKGKDKDKTTDGVKGAADNAAETIGGDESTEDTGTDDETSGSEGGADLGSIVNAATTAVTEAEDDKTKPDPAKPDPKP